MCARGSFVVVDARSLAPVGMPSAYAQLAVPPKVAVLQAGGRVHVKGGAIGGAQDGVNGAQGRAREGQCGAGGAVGAGAAGVGEGGKGAQGAVVAARAGRAAAGRAA